MACVGVAGVLSEVLPLQRSYWVPLTVAVVLKPDFGSVFVLALQRSIGTIVGAVAGAIILALVHGAWLLIPLAMLAAMLPFGRSRNYGLLSAFLTPNPTATGRRVCRFRRCTPSATSWAVRTRWEI